MPLALNELTYAHWDRAAKWGPPTISRTSQFIQHLRNAVLIYRQMLGCRNNAIGSLSLLNWSKLFFQMNIYIINLSK